MKSIRFSASGPADRSGGPGVGRAGEDRFICAFRRRGEGKEDRKGRGAGREKKIIIKNVNVGPDHILPRTVLLLLLLPSGPSSFTHTHSPVPIRVRLLLCVILLLLYINTRTHTRSYNIVIIEEGGLGSYSAKKHTHKYDGKIWLEKSTITP